MADTGEVGSESRQGALRRPSEPARVGAAPPPTSEETVTVACKLPNGVHMILYDVVVEEVIDLAGNKVRSNRSWPRPGAPTYILNGCAVDIEKMRAGRLPAHQIEQGDLSGTGYGLTSGIPARDWEEWSQTIGRDLVASGMVFAARNDREARAQAREKRNLRSGLEPIDPADPGPRAGLPRGLIRGDANPGSADV